MHLIYVLFSFEQPIHSAISNGFVEDMHSFGHSFTRCLKVGYLKDKLMNEWMNASKRKIGRAEIMEHTSAP